MTGTIKTNGRYKIRWYGKLATIQVIGAHWSGGYNVRFSDNSVKLVFRENFVREV